MTREQRIELLNNDSFIMITYHKTSTRLIIDKIDDMLQTIEYKATVADQNAAKTSVDYYWNQFVGQFPKGVQKILGGTLPLGGTI